MKLVNFWDQNVPSKRSSGIIRRAFWPQKIGSTWSAYLYGGGPIFVVEYDAILRISHFVVRMTLFYGGRGSRLLFRKTPFLLLRIRDPIFCAEGVLFFYVFPGRSIE